MIYLTNDERELKFIKYTFANIKFDLKKGTNKFKMIKTFINKRYTTLVTMKIDRYHYKICFT